MPVRTQLEEFVVQKDDITALFICYDEGAEYTVRLSFVSAWQHLPFFPEDYDMFVNDASLERAVKLLRGTMFLMEDQEKTGKLGTITYLESLTDTLSFSFTDHLVRSLFFGTLKAWIIHVKCPGEVRYIETVGYPTIAFHFQSHIFDRFHAKHIAKQIVHAIAHMEVAPRLQKVTAESELDEEAGHEDAEAFELELDPDLAARMKEIRERNTVEGGYETSDIVSEETAATAIEPEIEPFLIAPSVTYMYAVKQSYFEGTRGTLEDLETKIGAFFAHIPEEWMAEHGHRTVRWCFPNVAEAYRTLLGSYASEFTEAEILKNHPDAADYVTEIPTTDAMILLEHTPLGTLLMLPERKDEA